MKKKSVKNYKFIKFNDNWADEMDISGFMVMTEEKWKDTKKQILNIKGRFSIAFGSNEDNDYNNGKQLLDRLTIKNIDENEIKILKRLFDSGFNKDVLVEDGNNSWFNFFEDLNEEDENLEE